MNASHSLVNVALLAGVLSLASGTALLAQDSGSRAAALAAEQEEKARALSAPKAGFIERHMIAIEQAGGFGAAGGFGVAPGLFVTFGDIKRGSGLSLGPAYGKTFSSGAVFQAKAAYSISSAKMVQVALQAPLASKRLTIRTRVRWQDVPDVSFYGLGSGVPGAGAAYAETQTEVSATAAFRPVRLLRFGAGIGVERFETAIAPGSDPARAGLFTGAPGVGADPQYVHGYGSAAIDSRNAQGYSRHGSLLRATLHDYRQQNAGPYSFRRVDGVAEQYLPILRGNWVIYFGLRASTTTTGTGAHVPFFLLPDLGGHDLRGYDNYRFRDRHSVLMTAEYRWYAQEFLDGAIFYDAGKAVSMRRDLDFSDFKSSYGAGIRLHGPRTTVVRLEVARSREGTRLILAFSPVGG